MPSSERLGMAVAHRYDCHGVTALARGHAQKSFISFLISTAADHSQDLTHEWHVTPVRAALVERLPVETLHEAQSSMGPITSTFKYDLRTLMGTSMLPISNSRRIKTSLDSADYDMRRKIEKVVSRFAGKA